MWVDDEVLKNCRKGLCARIFSPQTPLVVLGSGNTAHLEADVEACLRHGVAIERRAGGGGTVVLHPGCVVISLGTWVRHHFMNQHYFNLINSALISSLEGAGLRRESPLQLAGISDISWKEKKVAGTSLFRSRHYLLYQASLIVENDVSLMEELLRHPTKEPSYRGRRSHRDFTMGLAEIFPEVSIQGVMTILQERFVPTLEHQLREEFVDPDVEYVEVLLKRITERFISRGDV